MENSAEKNTPHEGGIGPVIGSLIIVILLIAAALYFWSEHLATVEQIRAENRSLGSTTTTITYSTSTEPADIQNELEANPPIKSPGF